MWIAPREKGLVRFFFVVGGWAIVGEKGVESKLRRPEWFPTRVRVWGSLSGVAGDVVVDRVSE